MRMRRRDKIFEEYPDVVSVGQMCVMLGGIGKRTAYSLLKAGAIRYVKVGRSFKIPKTSVVEFMVGNE